MNTLYRSAIAIVALSAVAITTGKLSATAAPKKGSHVASIVEKQTTTPKAAFASGFICETEKISSTLTSLASLGKLSLAKPTSSKSSLEAGLGSLTTAGKAETSYFAITSKAVKDDTENSQTGLNDQGEGTCFADFSADGQSNIQLVSLNPIKETIISPQPGANLPRNVLTTFKAKLEGVDADRYTMYWQVDNDKLNLMGNEKDLSGKVTTRGIDLTGWEWHDGGKYTVRFIARDKAGKTVSQSAVTFWVTK